MPQRHNMTQVPMCKMGWNQLDLTSYLNILNHLNCIVTYIVSIPEIFSVSIERE